MKLITVFALAVAAGLIGGKTYFNATVQAAPAVRTATLSLSKTSYNSGVVSEQTLMKIFVRPRERVHEEVRNGMVHRFLKLRPEGEQGVHVHAIPELGLRMTTRWPADPSRAAIVRSQNCMGDEGLKREIRGIPAYGRRTIVEPAREDLPKIVHEVWRAPTLGCEAVETTQFDILPDGREQTVLTYVLTAVEDGVPEEAFRIDSSWTETSPGEALKEIVRATSTPEEFEVWLTNPSGIEKRRVLDQRYALNRVLVGEK